MHFKVRFDLLAELPIAAKKRSNLGDEATDQDLPWSSIGLPKPHGRMRMRGQAARRLRCQYYPSTLRPTCRCSWYPLSNVWQASRLTGTVVSSFMAQRPGITPMTATA